ncbi:FAD-dependent oxidoreductase [candidate division WOR-3 bacterium]|uniref:FAD-dependent oxidoreductase n=1 Tax=candidate division WOR-3 bacterium TaxID=2052148 RepID=A0A9D5QDH0_UNCW3|nr:FAD-dependent oxidoreductase [candidate division WOR-3 bacterium]MBD3365051.1 FAD-dependent oxidoreductase [candidate division WOR-3 bacterium]
MRKRKGKLSARNKKPSICVLGGGTAGLGAAYLAARAGAATEVFERRTIPGGLSLTRHTGDGFYHDLGGHRYYSPSRYLAPFLAGLLGDELIWTPRKSRFYLGGRFFDYPVQFTDVARKLPVTKSAKMLYDYVAEKFRSGNRREASFENWVVHRFGRALYEFNFENYTRKVWGMEPSVLSADWAALRIKGLSLGKVVKEFFARKADIATLVDRFLYPRHGIGQISHFLQKAAEERGSRVHLGSEVVKVRHDGKRVTSVTARDTKGRTTTKKPEYVTSSIDLDLLVRALDPPPPPAVLAAVSELTYRALVILFIRINQPQVTRDSWIYFPDESIPFSRWHEPKNWSPAMVPDADRSSLVVEFFADEGDAFWNAPAEELLELTLKHGRRLGLLTGAETGKVDKVLTPRAYPVWKVGYRKSLQVILDYLERLTNLSLIGRNGRFYYCTIDESLISGFTAVANFLEGKRTGPEPLPIEIPDNALGYLGLSSADLVEADGERWSRND